MKNLFTTIILFLFYLCIANASNYPKPIFQYNSGFIKNEGQITDCNKQISYDIKYYLTQNYCEVFFLKDRISFVFLKIDTYKLPPGDIRTYIDSTSIITYRADIIFENSSINATQTSIEENQNKNNFYLANCPKGITNVKSFKQIKYTNIYQNIDILFYLKDNTLKYDFIIKQGGKIEDIKLKPVGFDSLVLINQNTYIAYTPLGWIKENIPNINQNINNSRNKIEGSYYYENGYIQFHTKPFNFNYDLIIDPQIYWSTYSGGSLFDKTVSLVIDSQNNIIVSGSTYSINYPTTAGAYQTKNAGSTDITVSKISPDGNLIWSTFFGGSDVEWSSGGMSKTKSDDVWIAAETISNDIPITYNAYQKSFGGNVGDGLILKFSSNGQLLYSSYFGGNGYDAFTSCNMDKNGDINLVGWAYSTNLPITPDAKKNINGGNCDGMIVKIDNNYNLFYASYFGAGGDDFLENIAIDSLNNIIFGGFTNSINFPITNNAFQKQKSKDFDGFLVKMSPANDIIWSTYFGGNGIEYADRVTVDKDNNIYFCGYTFSSDLFTSNNAFQRVFGGIEDVFLSKFDSNGNILWSTYFGGNSYDGQNLIFHQLGGLEINPVGDILFTGTTQSRNLQSNMDAYQPKLKSSADAFIAAFTPDCKLNYCSYLGGSGDDIGYNLKFDTDINLIIVGGTFSIDFPIIGNSFQKNYNGNGDGFIVKFGTPDTSKPEILTNDSCNIFRTISINPKKLNNYIIKSVDIINAINCTVSTVSKDNCSATLLISVINPDNDAYYKITITLASGKQETIEDTIKANSISLASELIDNPTINFKWEKIGGVYCDSIKIYNLGNTTQTLDNIRLNQNIYFSIPQSQLPLIINPKDSVELYICLSPYEYNTFYKDILNITINCIDKEIQLLGRGDSIQINSIAKCNLPVKITKTKLIKMLNTISVSPNPATNVENISFKLNESSFISFTLYDIYGSKRINLTEIKYPEGTNEFQLNMNDLPDGLYFIELKTPTEQSIFKVLKVN